MITWGSVRGIVGDSSGVIPLWAVKCAWIAARVCCCKGISGLSTRPCFPCVAPKIRSEELNWRRIGMISLRSSVAIVVMVRSNAATCLEYAYSVDCRPNCFGWNLLPLVPTFTTRPHCITVWKLTASSNHVIPAEPGVPGVAGHFNSESQCKILCEIVVPHKLFCTASKSSEENV